MRTDHEDLAFRTLTLLPRLLFAGMYAEVLRLSRNKETVSDVSVRLEHVLATF